MAIVYLPSEGNIERVGIRDTNRWFGSSVGGAVLEKVRSTTQDNSKDYFVDIVANLSNSSTWFYNTITDYNFTNSITEYKCIYVGVDTSSELPEILGDIDISVAHNGPAAADNSVTASLLFKGVYTGLTSQGTEVLDNDEDITEIISNDTGWTNSITYSTPLNPGQYLKLFIRLEYNSSVLNDISDEFEYTITIKDLAIPVKRLVSRFNKSNVFSTNISDTEVVLDPTIPEGLSDLDVYKIYNDSDLTYVIHTDPTAASNTSSGFKILVIQNNDNPIHNKYVEIKSILPNLLIPNSDDTLTNFMDCCSFTIGASSTPASSCPTSATEIDPDCFPCLSDITANAEMLATNHFVDIIKSNKEELNRFYIVYNDFIEISRDDDLAIGEYGLRSNILSIDVSHIQNIMLNNVEEGIDNKLEIDIYDATSKVLRSNFVTDQITIQDDLLTGIGYIPSKCDDNNVSLIWNLWEGDITKPDNPAQFFHIPNSKPVLTVENKARSLNYLEFDETSVNIDNQEFVRSVNNLNDGNEYVSMGPPTQKTFKHGYTDVRNVINDESDEYNEFSSTWSFGIVEDSIKTPMITAAIVEPSGCNDPTFTYNPNSIHVLDSQVQSDSYDYISSDYLDQDMSIFKMQCGSASDDILLLGKYNFCTCLWKVYTINKAGDTVENTLAINESLSPTYINTITVNMYPSDDDYGCDHQTIYHVELYINGIEIFNDITYYPSTPINNISIVHNHDYDFNGYLSYWDISPYVSNNSSVYAENMHRINSNISWAEVSGELNNPSNKDNLKHYNNLRNVKLRNLNKKGGHDITYPIVLQGSGYALGDEYNKEVTRSVFDFSKIDISNLSLDITYDGIEDKLDWELGFYDINKDILVIWVRLPCWSGQQLNIYYSDSRLVDEDNEVMNPFDSIRSLWTMDNLVLQSSDRFVERKLFNDGNVYVYTKDINDNLNLVRIDRQYPIGYESFYKSNMVDIKWDDRLVDFDNTQQINDFIHSTADQFIPNTMEVRTVGSLFEYDIESDNNNSNRGEISNDDKVFFPR